jgi:hypothetical protein
MDMRAKELSQSMATVPSKSGDGGPILSLTGKQHTEYGRLAQRLQMLLDTVADISLCQRGNVSATMACLKDDKGTLETRLYIVFNHKDDEAARC